MMSGMSPRERFLETLLFGTPDRIPLQPGGGRESTLKRWHAEGLPEGMPPLAYARQELGIEAEEEPPADAAHFGVQHRMIPQFEEKVIEVREHSQVVQDWKGNVCEIGKEFGVEYLRNAIDFVTRRWIKCPVENREDWEGMKARYNAEDPERLPDRNAPGLDRLRERRHPIAFGFNGPFWQLREWLGFENLCMLLHDDPEFAREMIVFWSDFVNRLLERAFDYVIPDKVMISEDMAYKQFSMISPAMAKEFLQPVWSRWRETARAAGVPVFDVDSDGFIGELIPLWVEAGVNCCHPIEVAAGNDIVAFRDTFGKKMAYHGGVDKRAMAKGGRALEEEIRRIEPVVKSGGFIPGCDHGIPSDVSLANYVQTVRLLAEVTGWL